MARESHSGENREVLGGVQLPYAVVWNGGERTDPWGDANVGAPSFNHRLTLIVDVLASAADETTLDADIVGFVETIRATLLTDATWVNLFEGIERCDTRYAYPKEAQSIRAQGTLEFEVTYRSEWPPVVPNDLLEVAVTATQLPGSPEILDVTFEAF